MVEITAPATLQENFTFPASAQGRTFMVTVPKGGIIAGQRFKVPLPPQEDCIHPRPQVTTGEWKDGLWDIFGYGFCHPSVIHSCCFTNIASAQVISRLQLNFWGLPTNNIGEATSAYRKMFLLVFVYWCIRIFLYYHVFRLDPESIMQEDPSKKDEELSIWYYLTVATDDSIWYCYYAFCVYILKNVRHSLRTKYAIPESKVCRGCEDITCSLICPCFTAAQMLRHTTDYDQYDAKCCTSTGVPSYVPSIV